VAISSPWLESFATFMETVKQGLPCGVRINGVTGEHGIYLDFGAALEMCAGAVYGLH